MAHIARKPREDRADGFNRCRVPAGKDHQVALGRLRPCARDGAVQQNGTGLGGHIPRRFFRVQGQGAHFGQDLARAQHGAHLRHGSIQRRDRRQGHQDHIRRRGDGSGTVHRGPAAIRQSRLRGLHRIIARHGKTGLVQVAGIGDAHYPKPDKAYAQGFGHAFSPSQGASAAPKTAGFSILGIWARPGSTVRLASGVAAAMAAIASFGAPRSSAPQM